MKQEAMKKSQAILEKRRDQTTEEIESMKNKYKGILDTLRTRYENALLNGGASSSSGT